MGIATAAARPAAGTPEIVSMREPSTLLDQCDGWKRSLWNVAAQVATTPIAMLSGARSQLGLLFRRDDKRQKRLAR